MADEPFGTGVSNLIWDGNLLAAGAGVDWPTGRPKLKLCDDTDEKLYADVLAAPTANDWLPAAVRRFSVVVGNPVGKPEAVDESTDGLGAKGLLDGRETNGCGCFDISIASFCLGRLKAWPPPNNGWVCCPNAGRLLACDGRRGWNDMVGGGCGVIFGCGVGCGAWIVVTCCGFTGSGWDVGKAGTDTAGWLPVRFNTAVLISNVTSTAEATKFNPPFGQWQYIHSGPKSGSLVLFLR